MKIDKLKITPISPPSGVIHYVDYKYETDFTTWSIKAILKHLESFDVRETLEKEIDIIKKQFQEKKNDLHTVDSIINDSKKLKLILGRYEDEEVQEVFDKITTLEDSYF